MVKGWVQHVNGKVIRGVGTPPTDGDVFLISENDSETCAVVNGKLNVGGKKVSGSYTVTMATGDVTYTTDAHGKVKGVKVKPHK